MQSKSCLFIEYFINDLVLSGPEQQEQSPYPSAEAQFSLFLSAPTGVCLVTLGTHQWKEISLWAQQVRPLKLSHDCTLTPLCTPLGGQGQEHRCIWICGLVIVTKRDIIWPNSLSFSETLLSVISLFVLKVAVLKRDLWEAGLRIAKETSSDANWLIARLTWNCWMGTLFIHKILHTPHAFLLNI